MNSFIPSTKDLLSFIRPQSLTAPQQQFVRDKIGIDDALDDWIVTWSSIESGALPVDRLPSVVGRKDQSNTWAHAQIFDTETRFKTATWHKSTEGKQRFYFDGDGTTYIQGHAATPLVLRNGDGSDVLTLASTHEVSFGANLLKIHSDSTGPWIQSYASKPLRLNPIGNEVMFTDNYWIQSTGGVNRINFATNGPTYIAGAGSGNAVIIRNGAGDNVVTVGNTGASTFNGSVSCRYGVAIAEQSTGNDSWLVYRNNGDATLYFRDLTYGRTHMYFGPASTDANASTFILSKLYATEAAEFRKGISITGAFPHLSSGQPGSMSYEYPYTRHMAGDGSGYTWAVSKRVGGVTTDLFTIYDANGAATFSGNVGIGRTAPTYKIDALSDSTYIARFANHLGTQAIYQDGGGGGLLTSNLSGWYSSDSLTAFLINGSSVASVNSSGGFTGNSLSLTNGSNKQLKSYRDPSYSGWYNSPSIGDNEAYYMGSGKHLFAVGATTRLEVAENSQFTGSLTVTGMLNVGPALNNNRLFQDSGNLYIESDGTIFMRDTSTAAVLWSLVNDGRTFSKTNVWHSDSDGNPRIAYYASGGDTVFYGGYNFVSSNRGHGLLNDGTIVWGSNQTGNHRGRLSWDTDKAIIHAPLNMDITLGGGLTITAPSGLLVAAPTTYYGAVTSIGDTNGIHSLTTRNENAGSNAYSRVVVNAYGNSWGIGMGSTANNSNALEIREDALGANTLRFKMDIGGAATFSGPATINGLVTLNNNLTFGTVDSQGYITGPTGELLIGEDATGYFMGYGFGVQPVKPMHIGHPALNGLYFRSGTAVESLAPNVNLRGALGAGWSTLKAGNTTIYGSLFIGDSDCQLQRTTTASTALKTYETSLSTWQEPWRGQASASGATIGFLGSTPLVRQTLPAAATDAATTQTLANALRDLAINFGLAN